MVDCAGEPAGFVLALDAVRRGGRIVELGQFFSAGTVEFDPSVLCGKDLEITGCALGPSEAYPKAVRLLEDPAVPWEALVTDAFALDDVASAFEAALSRERGKVVVEPNGQEAER